MDRTDAPATFPASPAGNIHVIRHAVAHGVGLVGRDEVGLQLFPTVTASGSVCEVEEPACIACDACIDLCRYDAIH